MFPERSGERSRAAEARPPALRCRRRLSAARSSSVCPLLPAGGPDRPLQLRGDLVGGGAQGGQELTAESVAYSASQVWTLSAAAT